MHALVLFSKPEGDLIGIWGPYLTPNAAESAKSELTDWPIDGVWDIMQMKEYPGREQPFQTFVRRDGTTSMPPYTITNTNRADTSNCQGAGAVTDFYGGFHGQASDG